MRGETIPEIAQWLCDSAQGCAEYVKKSNNLGLALFLDPIEKIGKDSALYLQGRLPLTAYSRQLASTGGRLLKNWSEVKKDAHGELSPELEAAMKALTDSPGGDEKKFKDVMYAMQHQKDWVFMDEEKTIGDPVFGVLLQCARICRRSLNLQQQGGPGLN